ncbi:MAG: hypothetical protein MUE42_06045 [Opitutaceae bacterium]|jgi:hypothetical protein|nr:hypothetical protein [Opitutaceae bacterium]
MSLINEALKKAQRQRSLDAAPLSSAPSGVAAAAVTTHVAAATLKRRRHAPLWFGLALLTIGAVATALIMRYGFTPPPATPLAPAASAALPAPAAEPAAPIAVAPVADTTPQIVLPSLAAPAPTAPVAPAAARPVEPAPATPPAPVATPVAAPAPAPSPAPLPVSPVVALPAPAESAARIYAFLNEARLTGVRGLDAQARVLMNERVYRLNDVVSPELGLRLSAVRPGLLVFTDAQGRTYEKPY